MRRIIHLLLCSFAILGCSRDAAPDETSQIHERLNGKYKAVSSISSETVDVNLDGTASINILTEIPELGQSNLEIRIVSKQKSLFCQFWPQQLFAYGINPTGYDPSLSVNYANQGISRIFSLDDSQSSLQLAPDTSPLPDLDRFPFPVSVTIEEPESIRVVISKRLYTSAGWKTVTITTLYERYTKIT